MPERRALIAAVDTYPEGRGPNLESCLKDAQAMVQLLREHFRVTQITTLLDSDCTVRAFLEAQEELFSGLDDDDKCVIFWSGHGKSKWSSDGEKEEYIALFDDDLQDDEIVSASQSLPPNALTLILDCCFAGGMFKATDFELPNGTVLQNKSAHNSDASPDEGVFRVKRFGMPSVNLLAFEAVKKNPGILKGGFAIGTPSDEEDPQLNGMLIGAASEYQLALGGNENSNTEGLSVCTFAIKNAIEEIGPDKASEEILREAGKLISSRGFPQTLQLFPSEASARTIVDQFAVKASPEPKAVFTSISQPCWINKKLPVLALMRTLLRRRLQ